MTDFLEVGQKVGVYSYSPTRGGNARIATVTFVTRSGQVTLDTGRRYTASGKEIGAIDPTYLCSAERAQELIDNANAFEEQRKAKHQAYADSPEGRRRLVSQHSARLVIAALQERGWFPDSDGAMDSLQFEIETRV